MAFRRSLRTTLLLGVFIAASLWASSAIRSTALAVFRLPFTALTAAVRTVLTLPRLSALSEENARLREALAGQRLETAQIREALRQTRQGDALLKELAAVQGVVAPVIGRSLLPTQQTVLLGRGRRHGLALDGIALDAGGVVGRIIEVHPDASLVLLLTDEDSRVAGLVERSRETGLLVGHGHGALELAYVDPDADIAEGDVVVTAGLGGPYPKGLPLGRVVRVTKDAASGLSRVLVRPAARLGLLEDVLCIPPAAQRSQPS